METCKICGESFKNLKALSTHLNFRHKISSKDYYDKHLIKLDEAQCSVCGRETTYRGLGVGYLKTCSIECVSKDKDYLKNKSESRKGKKQSAETIKKRIENTNQEKKELNRKKTMLNKYGVDNPTKLDEVKTKLSEKLTGTKLFRTDEWQKNIIESKRNNGTLKHSQQTKNKIRDSINNFYSENLEREKYVTISNNVKHLSGWYNGLYFRSSLELSFLINNNSVNFVSCESKNFGVLYQIKDKIKTYFPDYTDGDLVYEIKPTSLLEFGLNPIKIKKGKEKYGDKYVVITENESPYVPKHVIIDLIENGHVVLTKNSENIFKKYRY